MLRRPIEITRVSRLKRPGRATSRREPCAQLVLASLTFAHFRAERSQIYRNNLTLHTYSRLRVFAREFRDDPQGGMTSRKVFYEQKTRFCVCSTDGNSLCSARAGEVTIAVRFAREPDYRERKRFLLVCEQRGRRCGAENAGRKLFLQTDTGGSHFWPARWPRGRRFVHVLFASHR